MELNERAELDTSQVNDRGRGGGAGGGIGIPLPGGGGRGGIIGIVVAVLVALLGGGFGLNAMTNGEDGGQAGGGADLEQVCSRDNAQRFDDIRCRNLLYVNSIQAYWKKAYPELGDGQYEPTDTNYFQAAVNTGCGQADSGVGPFYCPADRQVYIDLSFYDELASRFGAKGEFAQPYVLAHEYGHHVQNLLGTNAKAGQGDQSGPRSASVRLELQADCYAGAWAKNSTESKDKTGQEPLFTSITETDIKEALVAAEAIGDDSIQERSGGQVNPDSFTHGTSEQRQRWFRQGFDSGTPKTCDTFGTDQL
ncbi:neutral zinc metallopeptidase [Micromonospora sp. WMMD964]|uniref:KPN_02809 family neutral zinc metallopeptidase n=1 Tax=Micromonospora sp. WMMD964 TaxID=3016091 RepID=UPI00249A580F|nr:neutral zinc metallopeptidase [Micromonospora sp. WMMD964]WFF00418.1 neutral zinc metallopeptidase [Micromonospora sp. WMMD964]